MSRKLGAPQRDALKKKEVEFRVLEEKLRERECPILFVEGTTDIDYVVKASELLDESGLVEQLNLQDGVGSGGLDRILKRFDTELSRAMPQKILLLYDCDTNKSEVDKGKLYVRRIPHQPNIIDKGIENLFSNITTAKAKLHKPAFFDITPSFTKTIRGEEITTSEEWQVNRDEKRNLCNWLVENGTAEDFQQFEIIFEKLAIILIEE